MFNVTTKLAKVKEQARLPLAALYEAIGMLKKKYVLYKIEESNHVLHRVIHTIQQIKLSNFLEELVGLTYTVHPHLTSYFL